MRLVCLFTFVLAIGCNSRDSHCLHSSGKSAVTEAEKKSIRDSFYVVNSNTDGGNKNLDVYVMDTNIIDRVNEYLVPMVDDNSVEFIEINYYSNDTIAKTYMAKQLSDNVSEKVKNRLFKYFIAEYKHNHITGYKNLFYEHR